MKLNNDQLIAVKYYEGDVSGSDPFWSDGKAYVTMNSLLYPGIDTEIRRIKEGKLLNSEIVADPNRLVKICKDLLSAFDCPDLSKKRKTFRVERYADYLAMKQFGGTLSFTSTSTGGFLKYYTDRIGIALMEFEINENIPCFPFLEMLSDGYKKIEEQEILLPPYLEIEFNEVPLNESDLEITDAQNDKPIVKCEAKVVGKKKVSNDIKVIDIYDRKVIDTIVKVINDLNDGKEIDKEEKDLYINWKENFQKVVLG